MLCYTVPYTVLHHNTQNNERRSMTNYCTCCRKVCETILTKPFVETYEFWGECGSRTLYDGEESACCRAEVTEDAEELVNESIMVELDGELYIARLVLDDDGEISEAFFDQFGVKAMRSVFTLCDLTEEDVNMISMVLDDVLIERQLQKKGSSFPLMAAGQRKHRERAAPKHLMGNTNPVQAVMQSSGVGAVI